MADPHNVKSIFSAAIEKPLSERAAFLEQAVGNDSVLRVRVEALLKAHDNQDNFLKEPAAEFGATIDLSPAELPLAERPGTLIGPYKLLEQIGEGGMGVVYMADQQSPVHRRVALKIIKAGMDTRQVIARFEAERQALALMDHSNIARVLDAGATESGRPYFVMELVRGIPITEYCDQSNLPVHERLELFVQVCHAVQHAHQKGIIHRDLKPSNVLVTLNDGRAVPKVIDFGVAKATGQQLTEKTLFTAFAQLVGTPLYMSPEQAEMTSVDIDTRSDIYSLGVLLYELLTGTTPFDQERMRSAAFDEVRRIIREEEPPTPSTRLSTLGETRTATAAHRQVDAHRLGRLLKGDLDWIVMKALEKDRTRRYDTANTLALDVERYLNDEPVEASPPSDIYRLRKFIRRNRVGVLAGVAIAGALLVGLALATIGFMQARRQRDIAEDNVVRADRAADTATAVSQSLQQMLHSADPVSGRSGDYTVRQLLDDYAQDLPTKLAGQPEAEAEIQSTIGLGYRRLGDGSKAEQHLGRALQLRRQVFGEDHEKVAEARMNYAWSMRELERNDEAERQLRAALTIYRSRQLPSPQFVYALRTLQLILSDRENWDEVESVGKEALEVSARCGETASLEVMGIYTGLGQAKMARFEYPDAEKLLRKAVEMHAQALGPDHLRTAWTRSALADALQHQGYFVEAISASKLALVTFRRVYPPDHWSLRMALTQIITHLQAAKHRSAHAELLADPQLLNGVDSSFRAVVAAIPVTPENVNAWAARMQVFGDLAKVYDALGQSSLALQKTEQAEVFSVRSKALREEMRLFELAAVELAAKAVQLSPSDGNNWNTLGVARYRAGQWQPAIDALSKSIDLRKRGEASDWIFLAMAHYQLDHKDQARTWYDKAVEWMDKTQFKNDELTLFRAEATELLGISEPAKSTDAATEP